MIWKPFLYLGISLLAVSTTNKAFTTAAPANNILYFLLFFYSINDCVKFLPYHFVVFIRVEVAVYH